MKKKLKANKNKRKIYRNLDLIKSKYRFLLQTKLIKKHTQFFFFFRNVKLPLKSICSLTGYSRSTYKFLNISRFKLKNYLEKGLISGFKKFS